MKTLKEHIVEGLKIGANTKVNTYSYHPKTCDELKKLVNKLIKERGNDANLNDIDTSKITDMYSIFYNSYFNGDISKWDVSNVNRMGYMFAGSEFTGENGDISGWDVSNVENMGHMFEYSKFSGDISGWDAGKVKYISNMFKGSPLEDNPPKWYNDIRNK